VTRRSPAPLALLKLGFACGAQGHRGQASGGSAGERTRTAARSRLAGNGLVVLDVEMAVPTGPANPTDGSFQADLRIEMSRSYLEYAIEA